MSTPTGVNRESFQRLLASAFAVQQSGMDTRSLSILLDLQQTIARGKLNADQVLHLIAEGAQNVAHASGVAIALLKGDQLVYRAGSGSATSYVGQRMTAVLNVSRHKEAKGEILRVENAETDGRIEADICRQFESQALLILPVYHENAVAGVLEVLFSEAHAFQDHELRAYRLINGLVEEAMFRKAEPGQEKQPTSVPHAIEIITSQMQNLRSNDNAAPVPVTAAPTVTRPRIRLPLPAFRINAPAVGVITALVIAAGSILYEHHTNWPASTSLRDSSSVQTPNVAAQGKLPAVPASATTSSSAPRQRIAARRTSDTNAPSSAFKRVQVGPNEVDYVAEDVTVRQFRTPQNRKGYKEVQLGEDVTVRYFNSKPTVAAKTLPVSAASQAGQQPLPTTK